MTTPTRQQVVQWGKEAEKLANAACKEIPGMEYRAAEAFALITLARADLEATIAEQVKQLEEIAEAIRVKDESINSIANWLVCACISSAEDMAQSFPSMLEIAEQALSLQPSPEILAARDQRVAEACAELIDSMYVTEKAAEAIRSGKWKEYL